MLLKMTDRPANSGAIQPFYPGLSLDKGDTGIGSIGRIDHAYIAQKHTIAMHPHINDEILSYFRTGTAQHRDSMGIESDVGGTRLMLMKAGKIYHHEETVAADGKPLEGLQIFIRPKAKDLPASVEFFDLDNLHSPNAWRLLAAPTNAPFAFSSQTWLYDVKLTAGNQIELPQIAPNLTALLYVYQGEISVNGETLGKTHRLLIQDEQIQITSEQGAELVLFVTDENAEIYKDGMYSGNQL